MVAIGGITRAQAAAIAGAGAHCLAAISGICRAPDPTQAARELAQEFARGHAARAAVLSAAADATLDPGAAHHAATPEGPHVA